MKAVALTFLFLVSILSSPVVSAREIVVLETFTGVQYSKQLETPFKPIHPNLRLSDLSQNLDLAEIENFYTFRHSISPQKPDSLYVLEFLFEIVFPRIIITF